MARVPEVNLFERFNFLFARLAVAGRLGVFGARLARLRREFDEFVAFERAEFERLVQSVLPENPGELLVVANLLFGVELFVE